MTKVAFNAIEAWDQSSNKLRILLVISIPVDETTHLNLNREVEQIYRQLLLARVPAALIRLNPPTWHTLRATLQRRHFDIVHFVGHARKDSIQLEKENGSADWISIKDFSALFHNVGVKLVVLNNCNSEKLGDALVSIGIPAVIATSKAIHTYIATQMAGSLYASLASGLSPREAVMSIHLTPGWQSDKKEEPFIVELGPEADQPILNANLGSGDTEFFSCTPPDNLPTPNSPEIFWDRVPELLNIYGLLENSHSPFIGITGFAGTGKSTIANVAARRYGWRFPAGIAYASLRKMRPFSLISLLAHFDWNLEEVPLAKQRAAALQKLADNPILIVLDDLEVTSAAERETITDLLRSWNTSLGGRAILVMRTQHREFDSLVQSNWIRVGPLPRDAVLNLFSSRLGGPEAAKVMLGSNLTKIPNLCYHHPKLIELTAAALHLGIPWNEVELQLGRFQGMLTQQIDQVLELTLSQVSKESPIASQFLDCWPVFTETATEEAWRYVLTGQNTSEEYPQRHLQSDALAIMQRSDILHRLTYKNNQQCRIHPIISDYLKIHRWTRLSPEKRNEFQKRHIEFYASSISTSGINYPIIEEWNNILAALERARKASNWHDSLALCIPLVGDNPVLLSRNLWNYAKQVLSYAIETALHLSELQWQARFLHNLGYCQYRIAEYQEAKLSFERSLAISQQIADSALIIDTTIEIGRVCYRLVIYETAKECFARALHQAQTLKDLKRIANAQHELGRLAYRNKDYLEASTRHKEALKIREIIHDKAGIALTFLELGRTAQETKQLEEAEYFYQKSLTTRKDIEDIIGLQATIHQLGFLAFIRGNLEKSQQYYEECIELSNSLNDLFWIAHNNYRYGCLLWKLGQQEEGITLAKDAFKRCEFLGIGLKDEIAQWLVSPS